MIIDELIAEVERLDAEATKGPWIAEDYSCKCCSFVYPQEDKPYLAAKKENDSDVMYITSGYPATAPFNAPFMARSRMLLPLFAQLLKSLLATPDETYKAELNKTLAELV